MPSRASNAPLMVDSRAVRDIERFLGRDVACGGEVFRDLAGESQDFHSLERRSLHCRPCDPATPRLRRGLQSWAAEALAKAARRDPYRGIYRSSRMVDSVRKTAACGYGSPLSRGRRGEGV